MRVLLFDFDYTLADSSAAIVECLSYALNSAFLPVPPKKLMLSTIGMSLTDTFAALASGRPSQPLIESFRKRADEVMVDGTKLYKSVSAVIPALKRQGYLLGIVSTKYRFRIEAILERDRLLPFFDIIVGGEDVAKHKPDPEGLFKAMLQLHCDQQSVVFIGDSVIDAQTAIAAGVRFVGVCTGATSKKELQKSGALQVMEDLEELSMILDTTTVA
jgi:phosphoglycolate phosphatase